MFLSTLTRLMQEKYEEAMILYAQMEKRAVMAETMLEATIQYQSSQLKAQSPLSPRYLIFCWFDIIHVLTYCKISIAD